MRNAPWAIIIILLVVVAVQHSSSEQPTPVVVQQTRIPTPKEGPVSQEYINDQFRIQDEMAQCAQDCKNRCGYLGKVDVYITGESVSPSEAKEWKH